MKLRFDQVLVFSTPGFRLVRQTWPRLRSQPWWTLRYVTIIFHSLSFLRWHWTQIWMCHPWEKGKSWHQWHEIARDPAGHNHRILKFILARMLGSIPKLRAICDCLVWSNIRGEIKYAKLVGMYHVYPINYALSLAHWGGMRNKKMETEMLATDTTRIASPSGYSPSDLIIETTEVDSKRRNIVQPMDENCTAGCFLRFSCPHKFFLLLTFFEHNEKVDPQRGRHRRIHDTKREKEKARVLLKGTFVWNSMRQRCWQVGVPSLSLWSVIWSSFPSLLGSRVRVPFCCPTESLDGCWLFLAVLA